MIIARTYRVASQLKITKLIERTTLLSPLRIRHNSTTAMGNKQSRIRSVPMPKEGLLFGKEGLSNISFSDSYALTLPNSSSYDAIILAKGILEPMPGWIKGLLWLRDHTFARILQLKETSKIAKESKQKHEMISFFPILEKSFDKKEVLLGLNDGHLDFRLSIKVQQIKPSKASDCAAEEVVMSTVVKWHNWSGKLYLYIIKPFHILIVKSQLKRLQKTLESSKHE